MTFPLFSSHLPLKSGDPSMDLAITIFQSIGLHDPMYYAANQDLFDYYLDDDDDYIETMEMKRQKKR